MVERGGIRPVALRAEDDQPLLAPVAEDDVVVDILTLKDRPICPADGTPVRFCTDIAIAVHRTSMWSSGRGSDSTADSVTSPDDAR